MDSLGGRKKNEQFNELKDSNMEEAFDIENEMKKSATAKQEAQRNAQQL